MAPRRKNEKGVKKRGNRSGAKNQSSRKGSKGAKKALPQKASQKTKKDQPQNKKTRGSPRRSSTVAGQKTTGLDQDDSDESSTNENTNQHRNPTKNVTLESSKGGPKTTGLEDDEAENDQVKPKLDDHQIRGVMLLQKYADREARGEQLKKKEEKNRAKLIRHRITDINKWESQGRIPTDLVLERINLLANYDASTGEKVEEADQMEECHMLIEDRLAELSQRTKDGVFFPHFEKEKDALTRKRRALERNNFLPGLKKKRTDLMAAAREREKEELKRKEAEVQKKEEDFVAKYAAEEAQRQKVNDEFISNSESGLGTFFQGRGRRRALTEMQLEDLEAKTEEHLATSYGGIPDSHVIDEDATSNGKKLLQLRRIKYEGIDPEDAKDGIFETWTLFFGPEGRGGKMVKFGNPEYILYSFGESFYSYCLNIAKKRNHLNAEDFASFPIPAWDCNSDVAPPSCLMKYDETGQPRRKLPFKQEGNSNYCMSYCVANALNYLGWHEEANKLKKTKAELISQRPADLQLRLISDFLNRVPGLETLKKKNGFQNLKGADVCLKKLKSVNLAVIVLEGKDNAVSHAIAYAEDMIFDSTQAYPLFPTKESLDFCCGEQGFLQFLMARTFKFTKTRKKGRKKA